MRHALGVILLLVIGSAQAGLVDYGSFTYDDVSGLDWLDISETGDMSMVDALSANSGWRFATNGEIEDLFSQTFANYFDTDLTYNWSRESEGAYVGQESDVMAFLDLFGVVLDHPTRDGTYGLYLDETATVRIMGVDLYPDDNIVFGLDFTGQYNNFYDTSSVSSAGTYLVRTSAVPIPAAVWLFGSGLALLGFARRRIS